MLSKNDLVVFPELYVVTIRGFEPKKVAIEMDDGSTYTDWPEVDPPGTSNWFCDQIGFENNLEDADIDSDEILWTDYDRGSNKWIFSCIVTSKGFLAIRAFLDAQEGDELRKYDLVCHRSIYTPEVYGDSAGTIVIMKHPEGFVIAE